MFIYDTILTFLTIGTSHYAPNDLIAEIAGNRKVHLTWSAPDVVDGTLRGYFVNCTPIRNTSIVIDLSGTSVTIFSLLPNTHYTCSVCAKTLTGCGPEAITYFSTYGDCEYYIALIIVHW